MQIGRAPPLQKQPETSNNQSDFERYPEIYLASHPTPPVDSHVRGLSQNKNEKEKSLRENWHGRRADPFISTNQPLVAEKARGTASYSPPFPVTGLLGHQRIFPSSS